MDNAQAWQHATPDRLSEGVIKILSICFKANT